MIRATQFIIAVALFAQGCAPLMPIRRGMKWLEERKGNSAINLTGTWSVPQWGGGTFTQNGGSLEGELGGYQAVGVVNGKEVFILFVHQGSLYWTAHLEVIHNNLLTGNTTHSRYGFADAVPGDKMVMERRSSPKTRPDKTAENIMWSVKSEPLGAKIHWRVISRNSDVQNTNRQYLGKTPYEETRPMDILGLTKINSIDVQIEIEIEKKGFEPQKKRLNCRSILDQREISIMYDLVAKP